MKLLSDEKYKEFKNWYDRNPNALSQEVIEKYNDMTKRDLNAITLEEERAKMLNRCYELWKEEEPNDVKVKVYEELTENQDTLVTPEQFDKEMKKHIH